MDENTLTIQEILNNKNLSILERERLQDLYSSNQQLLQNTDPKGYSETFLDLALKFSNSLNDPISAIFIYIIISYLVIITFFYKNNIGSFLSKNATSVLPSLGILGTFIGVFLAIQDFDLTGNLQRKMVGIISGLQIAFVTSIAGLFGGIAARLIISYRERGQVIETDVGPEEILEAIKRNGKDIKDFNKELIKAISGNDETSLSTHLTKMRLELSDFAKEAAKANSEAFIKALEEAINNFNKQLTEQLGDNFKHLNEAIGKLLTWQENYKDEMGEMKKSLDHSIQAIKEAEKSLELIKNSTNEIPNNMEKLTSIMTTIDTQLNNLESYLSAFTEVSEKAKEAFPRIENLLENYTDKLDQSMESMTDNVEKILSKQELARENLEKNYNQLSDDIGSLSKDFIDNTSNTLTLFSSKIETSVDENINNLGQKITKIYEDQDDKIKNIADTQETLLINLQKDFNSLSTQTNEIINAAKKGILDQQSSLDYTVNEMNKNINNIGQSLESTVTNSIKSIENSYSDQLQKTMERQAEVLNKYKDDLHEQTKSSVTQLNETVKTLITETRDKTGEVLNEELQAFANNIGTIANRMVEDYKPLVDELRKLIIAVREAEKSK